MTDELPTTKKVICKHCEKEYETEVKYINRKGQMIPRVNLWCSKECYRNYLKSIRG